MTWSHGHSSWILVMYYVTSETLKWQQNICKGQVAATGQKVIVMSSRPVYGTWAREQILTTCMPAGCQKRQLIVGYAYHHRRVTIGHYILYIICINAILSMHNLVFSVFLCVFDLTFYSSLYSLFHPLYGVSNTMCFTFMTRKQAETESYYFSSHNWPQEGSRELKMSLTL